MIVHVVDGTGQSLGGVTVRASYRYSDGDAVPEATHCEVQDDGGYLVRRDRDDRDMVRPTDMQGAVEFLPNDTTAMPLFELELDAPLKASKPRLMRLGDEPITIVAVPR
jgi:hypothetical protein